MQVTQKMKLRFQTKEPRAMEKLPTKRRNELFIREYSLPLESAKRSTCVLLGFKITKDRDDYVPAVFSTFLSGNIYCSILFLFHNCVSWKDGLFLRLTDLHTWETIAEKQDSRSRPQVLRLYLNGDILDKCHNKMRILKKRWVYFTHRSIVNCCGQRVNHGK